jgi:hypothetical protein
METVPLAIVKLNRGLIVPLCHANNDKARRFLVVADGGRVAMARR